MHTQFFDSKAAGHVARSHECAHTPAALPPGAAHAHGICQCLCTGLLSMDDSNSAQRVAKAMGALEVLDEEKMVYCLPPPFSWNSSGAVIIFAEQCHDPS